MSGDREIAMLRAQLRAAEIRAQAALDDLGDAEARGYRRGAAACLADVEQLEVRATTAKDTAPTHNIRWYHIGSARMARLIIQRNEHLAAGRYREPTEAQIDAVRVPDDCA